MFDGASLVFDAQRPPRRARASSSSRTCSSSTSTTVGRPIAGARIEPALEPGARGLRGARARHARLRAQERLHRRADQPLGRDRLVARRRDRGRRARRRARERRDAAVALLERGQRRPTRAALARAARHRAPSRCRSSRRTPRSRRCSRRCSTAARPTSPRRTCRRASAATSVMTISNKFGWMVLSCGNKSEMATGYATLYGDMAGGFAVIKDVPEDARVRAVPRSQRAAGREVIPQAVIDEAAVGRAATRPEGHRLAARLRRARPDHRGLRRRRRVGRRSSSTRGFDAELVRRVAAHGRSQRVQAPAGAARRARLAARRSARTAACRSPTAGPADARRAPSTAPADVEHARRCCPSSR